MDADSVPAIPYSLIAEHFSCAVCLGVVKMAMITPCGHRFCTVCISEVVDRSRKCPLCNANFTSSQLVRDRQLEGFLTLAEAEREKAQEQHMENLFKKARDQRERENAATQDKEKEQDRRDSLVRRVSETGEGRPFVDSLLVDETPRNPFEIILQKHMRNFLTVYEKHLMGVRTLCQRQCLLVASQAEQECQDLKERGLPNTELERRLHQINQECDEQKTTLNRQLHDVIGLMATSFDQQLDSTVPDLSVLPVKVTLSVPGKDFKASNVTLSPSDSCDDIVRQLKNVMAEAGRAVESVEDDYKLVLFGPFARGGSAGAAENQAGITEGIVLAPGCRPQIQYSVKPNSEIQLIGTVILKSDLPKKCYAKSYVAGDNTPVDYYACKECNLKWLCRNCMLVCHKGHNGVEPFILAHQPTWACCYCNRKKKCGL